MLKDHRTFRFAAAAGVLAMASPGAVGAAFAAQAGVAAEPLPSQQTVQRAGQAAAGGTAAADEARSMAANARAIAETMMDERCITAGRAEAQATTTQGGETTITRLVVCTDAGPGEAERRADLIEALQEARQDMARNTKLSALEAEIARLRAE